MRMRRLGSIAAVLGLLALPSASAAATPVIVLDQSAGGFSAPMRMVVAADGTVTVTERSTRRFHVSRAAVRQIRRLASDMHFSKLHRYYGPATTSDQPTFDVTFGGHSVRTESGTPPAPPRLWALIGQLTEIAADGAHPPLLRLNLTTRDGSLSLLVRHDGTAQISDSDDGSRTRHLARRCVGRIRHATRALATRRLRIGAPPLPLRHPTLAVTLDYEYFNVRLDRPVPRSVQRLRKLAVAVAGGRCR
jgi:hypothetical protein